MHPIILASSSIYRRELLTRFQIPFSSLSPNIDETPRSGENANDLCLRLAIEKARFVSTTHPDAIVIGSDQCADLNGTIINKPNNQEEAFNQLIKASGETMVFYTALCVICGSQNYMGHRVVETTVKYRQLKNEEINRYLIKDQPFDCAGSARIESLGIALVEWVKSDDPTALIGLPLIETGVLLRQCGVTIP